MSLDARQRESATGTLAHSVNSRVRDFVQTTLLRRPRDRRLSERCTSQRRLKQACHTRFGIQDRQKNFRAGQEKHGKNFGSLLNRSGLEKPIKSMISFYYRSKHVDGACRRGPVLLMETWKGEEDGEDRVANHWLQVRCECKRWVRILDYLRYMYTVCQDCEKVLCICPACTTPISLPKGSHVKGESAKSYACPNCSHWL
mmetsp:Transcript_49206/g.154446  ORF Transcript_49206/g.154446 Transcript_49206/m.154446 type:complete len:200 (-) Transcript_49206:43-642(-)